LLINAEGEVTKAEMIATNGKWQVSTSGAQTIGTPLWQRRLMQIDSGGNWQTYFGRKMSRAQLN
jgi:hypothetical protein